MKEQPIILFDGICNLCNRVVRFVIRRDKKKVIRFAALQSEAGQGLLQKYHLPVTAMESFVFIENGKVYSRSSAALKVCRHLRGLWPLCYGFIIVPEFIRDAVYNWVAKNRYKWFGVRAECMIPTPEIKARFLN
ncbi:MAG: thiol-disulfide oxidoreductase DCC family protein [Chitinophagaceae bacterium]|nr:thiol-disulfide oxidoreductase DCC family protein [Chitinophagaceae bacterium]